MDKKESLKMKKLVLRIMGDEALREMAAPVTSFDADLANLAENMAELMYKANGVGLAAPQVGVLKRLIAVDINYKDEGKNPIFLVNPKIIHHSKELCTREEGCLSIPEYYAEVVRPEKVKFSYFDVKGKPHEIECDGTLARCVQHEIDHLNGVLFTDYLSKLKRDVAIKKMQKLRKDLNLPTLRGKKF